MLQKEFIVGSSGVGSQMDIYPAMMNKLFGTKIKVIGGYKDGASIFLAMERGEIHGRCGPQITAIKSTAPAMADRSLIVMPIMVSERRSAEFPDAPSIMEFAKDEATRQQVRLLIVSQDWTVRCWRRPACRRSASKVLRNAFNATMADPAFLADIKRLRLTLDWVNGKDVAKTLAAAYAMPAPVVAAAKEIMGGK